MGVGTNFFPMGKDKIPQLQRLLTEFEFTHIEAFPSFVRLLAHRRLIQELLKLDSARLRQLEKISFFRVIDNQPLSLTTEQLFVQLNFQLIHLLDFLPASHWTKSFF